MTTELGRGGVRQVHREIRGKAGAAEEMPRGGQGVEESSLLSSHPNLHAQQSHSPGKTLNICSGCLLLHTQGRQRYAVERVPCVSLDTGPQFPHM